MTSVLLFLAIASLILFVVSGIFALFCIKPLKLWAILLALSLIVSVSTSIGAYMSSLKDREDNSNQLRILDNSIEVIYGQ